MPKIDNNMLDTMFHLSRLELKESEREVWLKELNYWLDFFSIDNFETPDVRYVKEVAGDEKALRLDSDEKPSLEVKEIKQFCNRFLDGFVVLPKRGSGEDSYVE